jgi:hypothetical protein
VFFFFLAAHALADYPFQTGAMATCKCRHANLPLQKDCPWYYWMAAHALIHGGTVGVLVKWYGFSEFAAVWLGIAEALIHFLIDSGKCERWYGMAVDQSLHVLCKGLWCLLLLRGIVS